MFVVERCPLVFEGGLVGFDSIFEPFHFEIGHRVGIDVADQVGDLLVLPERHGLADLKVQGRFK